MSIKEETLFNFTWRISFGGESWETDSLTFDELDDLEGILGVGWRDVTPAVAAHIPALVFVFLKRTMDMDAAKDRVVGLKSGDVRVDFMVEPIVKR